MAEMKWQPIETAPKDGTRILAYVPPYGVSTAHCQMYGPMAGNKWKCHSALNKSAVPTHWMPLPAPPSHPTQGDE